MLKIAHADGEIELTPDHVLLVDGQWAPAHTVKVPPSPTPPTPSPPHAHSPLLTSRPV